MARRSGNDIAHTNSKHTFPLDTSFLHTHTHKHTHEQTNI